jgi:hypothetical protein
VVLTVDGTQMTQDVTVTLDPDHPDGAWLEFQERAEEESESGETEDVERP